MKQKKRVSRTVRELEAKVGEITAEYCGMRDWKNRLLHEQQRDREIIDKLINALAGHKVNDQR